MKKGCVSIIVPVYNGETYLDDCILSLIEQTYKNIEIIIINDGSTDSSEDICQSWCKKDNRIIFLKKENGGVSSARNYGLNHVQGEYVMFVDGDDFLERNAVETIVRELIEQSVDVVAFAVREYNNDGSTRPLIKTESQKTEGNILPDTIRQYGFWLWNKIYKRELTDNLQFMTDLRMGEDILFMIQACHKAKGIYYHNEYLYNYRNNTSSVCKDIKTPEKLIKKVSEELKSHCIISNEIQSYAEYIDTLGVFSAVSLIIQVQNVIYLSKNNNIKYNCVVPEIHKYYKFHYKYLSNQKMKKRIKTYVVVFRYMPHLFWCVFKLAEKLRNVKQK